MPFVVQVPGGVTRADSDPRPGYHRPRRPARPARPTPPWRTRRGVTACKPTVATRTAPGRRLPAAPARTAAATRAGAAAAAAGEVVRLSPAAQRPRPRPGGRRSGDLLEGAAADVVDEPLAPRPVQRRLALIRAIDSGGCPVPDRRTPPGRSGGGGRRRPRCRPSPRRR